MDKIIELRKSLDTAINSVKELKPSAEATLAFRELQRAKMWLGKVLEVSGRENPYPKSDDPTSPVIEPQAEHEGKVWPIVASSPVAQVKFLRSKIQEIVDSFLRDSTALMPSDQFIFYNQAYLSAIESKMWLGMELDRIRTAGEAAPAIPNAPAPIIETNTILNFADFRKFSDTIVETGSGMGGGIDQMLDAKFNHILSVEAKDTYHEHCKKRFQHETAVSLYFGMSKDKMPEMLYAISNPAVFFLDAHVSGPNSAGHEDYLEKGNASAYAQDNCLTAELDMILDHGREHIIIIDDQNGDNPENVRYREMCGKANPNYRFYFYDEHLAGGTFYKNKSLVCIPTDLNSVQG